MKKILSCILAVAFIVAFSVFATSCNEVPSTEEPSGEKTYTIGVCQLVQHEALDAATEGFMAALKAKLGDQVKFDVQNAQGDSTTCSTICTNFVSQGYDLIMANATPALQAAVSATNTIPIVGTSVTDYASALAYDEWTGSTGINVTGTSDLAPLDKQEDMILELVPEVKKVAIIFCSAEANSKFQADEVAKLLKEDNVEYEYYTFADSNDIQSVVTGAIESCDVVYIPTDNTAASNMTIISNICQPAKIPVICGEENMTKNGGLATLSISYYDIGYVAGEMAFDILKNQKNPGELNIISTDSVTKKYNPEYAEAIGMTLPSDYEAIDMG